MSTLNTNPEYSEEYEDKPLPLKLYDKWDDEDDLILKHKLEALINGNITPDQAAIDLDTIITNDMNQKHEALMKRPDPRNPTPEEEAQGANMYCIMPHPRRWIEPLFHAIARLCSSFPPYHPGQTRIIDCLKALKALPRHDLYSGLPPEDPNEPYRTVTLWPIEGNWEAVAEIFDYEHVYVLAPYRWRNFNSFIARLTCSNLINCGFLSSLREILPSDREYPDLAKRPIDGPNKLGNYMLGAAQWIMWPDECRYVYEQCKRYESVSGPREMWSMERWREWKRQFAFVAGDGRFAQKYRDVAERAYRQILMVEEENLTVRRTEE
ncbi:hypothetical protein BO78DRAFT_425671 [Aspergillus sclerotiicarbonarius CBS 121057]|uniref:Uncharacterized protein n=1 Tax=Aspergillus sclerotiicarbonarius (strain CBS 121057 / IBT 28362) TaxID=1448318 RepID=A0A319FNE4_ASPSB|nr:hypothetical protein BO78DRAFT_425671 [Aspergillus sclerotiicarbonarius CBS 121057]